MAKTLYDILEVSTSASPEAIRSAYERLSQKYDPDREEHRGNADIRMRYEAVKEAFFTLGSSEKRARYDLSLKPADPSHDPVIALGEPFWTLPKVVIAVLVVLIASAWYIQGKREELRLATESAIAKARAQEAEARAMAEAVAAEKERLTVQQEREIERKRALQEMRTRNEFERTRRDFERERQRQEYAERFAHERQARQQTTDVQRREFERQRAEAANIAEARRRAAREKEELCRIERQRYGKAISC
jgi:curved DNA-binding protein CbpA